MALLRPKITPALSKRLPRLQFQSAIRPQFQKSLRAFHSSPQAAEADPKRHKRRDERPRSDETTQTDFGEMNVLGNVPPPASSIESCMYDGFVLSNGVNIRDSGMLLVGGEVFRWTPWNKDGTQNKSADATETAKASLVRLSGQLHIEKESWGILDLVWPKPGEINFW